MSGAYSSRWLSRALIALGTLGVLVCAGALGRQVISVLRERARARQAYEARRELAGPMVHVEATAHSSALWIDKTEVTVRAYRSCMEDGACTEPSTGRHCTWGKSDRDLHPINCVDQEQAKAYCEWAGRRLPGVREWELAACWFQTFPWSGPDLRDVDCFGRDAKWRDEHGSPVIESPALGTCPVDAHPEGASPSGALGMAGNVAEWTLTQDRGSGTPTARRYVKGATWADSPSSRNQSRFKCDTDDELVQAPHYRDSLIGIRCARDVERTLFRDVIDPRP